MFTNCPGFAESAISFDSKERTNTSLPLDMQFRTIQSCITIIYGPFTGGGGETACAAVSGTIGVCGGCDRAEYSTAAADPAEYSTAAADPAGYSTGAGTLRGI